MHLCRDTEEQKSRNMNKKDQLFSKPASSRKRFAFNQAVAEVFDDMIKRSVPGYEGIIEQIAALAHRVAKPSSRIYDLGSSLGAATMAIRRVLTDESIEIVAVDKSPAMIERSKLLLDAYQSPIKVHLIEDDIMNIDISNASLVIMNFTLQFIPLEQRDALIKKIYDGMSEASALVISEKIKLPGNQINDLVISLHEDFKRDRGYSELEISQKRDALQDVLVPETLSEHTRRLDNAGFKQSALWYQHYNFCSFLAIK